MSKLVKIFVVLIALLSFNFSTAAYGLQFADASKTVRLKWKKGVIPIALSTSLLAAQNSNILAQSDVEGAVRRSLQAWENVADIKFEIVQTDKQSVSSAGNAGDGVSLITIAQTPENLLLFSNETDDVSAQTRTFYNKQGFITEADIVLNPYQQFSTDGQIGTYDLESILTHEIGHLLGLDHSSVLGATMQPRQGKNGVYNLSAFAARTLADDDITGIRALYGTKNSEDNCCGTVIGKVGSSKSKIIKKSQVWAEESTTGRVISGVLTNPDGSFRFDGLDAGEYRFYVQDEDKTNASAAEELGEFEIAKNKTTSIIKKIEPKDKNFSIQYEGFNGQISDLAVPLNAGKSYVFYIGGKNLDPKNLEIGFNSPYLSADPKSVKSLDYGSDVSVLSFDLKVEAAALPGEYSVYIKSQNDSKQFLVGGLTIENFVNPWYNYSLPIVNKE